MPAVLLVYPSHQNCREAARPYIEGGYDVAVYPPRTTVDTPEVPQNCWNEAADDAERMGLPVVKAICFVCPSRQMCAGDGYLGQLAAATRAAVLIATHKRVEHGSFSEFAKQREYISVHENPVDILKPGCEVSQADLLLVKLVLDLLLSDPRQLDWFGDASTVDSEGNICQSEELAVRKERMYQFTQHLAQLADKLLAAVREAQTTVEWKPDVTLKRAVGIESLLFRATRQAQVKFHGQPWRFLLAAAGDLSSSAIIVTPRIGTAGEQETDLFKTVVGFRDNHPPRHVVTWFSDATLSADTLTAILGTEVRDQTPEGRLELLKKAIQVLRDVTRRTKSRIVGNILRGVLADRPQFRRIGVIGHQPHLTVLKDLGPGFESRIAKIAYFGSGEDRSSNAWHQECDLIIVAGTPRLPPGAIASYLIQIGDVAAACREPKWDTLKWDGQTEAGEAITVSTKGYRDEAWRRAYRDLVRAALVQAIGRGRGILESGCEVVVLSTEECGLLVSDAGVETLNESSTRVLGVLTELTLANRNIYILRNASVSTAELARETGLSQQRVRCILHDLERRGLVRRVSERGGWLPVDVTIPAADPRPPPFSR